MAPNFPPWRRRAPQPKLGVEVITTNISNNPSCTHGPTICFERFFVNGKSRKFYACSACRDQKACPFFLWADQTQPKASRNSWAQKIKESKPLRSHQDEFRRLASLALVSPAERGFCTVCNMLCLLPTDSDHPPTPKCNVDTIITPVENYYLTHPSQIVPLKNASKCEAQYLFTEKSCKAVMTMIQQLQADRVLCVGVPSVHESLTDTVNAKTSMLLDIDGRYRNFFPPTHFVHYNMFNHHFFDGPRAKQRVASFLGEGKKQVVVCDPPFGARMELLATTFKQLEELWRETRPHAEEEDLTFLLMFPYYLESRVVSALPNFSMLDYQLDYSNHENYTSGTKKAMKHGSAVRVFTNRPLSEFTLPSEEGYKHCESCNKWVYKNNVHCHICKGCMGKDGTGYKHCDECNTCVKPSWKHCDKCNKCLQQDHKCSTAPSSFAEAQKQELAHSCHLCGEAGHKRKDCPQRQNKSSPDGPPKKKRKVKKMDLPTTAVKERSQYMDVIQSLLSQS